MFSSRTDWDFRTSPLYTIVQKMRAEGMSILDLTESNPTKCGLQYPVDSLIPDSALKKSVEYEPDPKGLIDARRAIAQWYGRQGVSVDPSCIVLTSGTSEAYSFLLKLLCNPHDAIAVPKPGYPLFDYLARLHDVNCHQYRLAYDGEWHIDQHSLDDAISGNARAIVLIHPNNPTGSFVKIQERDDLLKTSRGRGIPLIVDEVFGSFAFARDESRAESFAGTQETLTFTVNGISKLIGLPQLKLAWIVVSGPPDLCSDALERLEIISDTFLSVGTPAQHALASLLEGSDTANNRIKERVRANWIFLSNALPSDSPASIFECEGAWNAILRLPATQSDEDWATELLRSQYVLTHPGRLFDCEAPACIVVSLLLLPAEFSEGIKRIISVIGTERPHAALPA
jgi:alanine-synthesizing transaminase